jgi:hypothetical protein
MMNVQYDCNQYKSRVMSARFYSGISGAGEELKVADGGNEVRWEDIVPESSGNTMASNLCAVNSSKHQR